MIRTKLEKQLELNVGLDKLNKELDEYSFNNHELSNEQKDEILSLYKLWKESLNNKIFIENESNSHIRVRDGKIVSVDKSEKDIYVGVDEKSTLFFSNCNNTTIIIATKVAHITFEGCNNINIKIIGGSVTGIDSIRCTHISFVFDKGDIYYIDISNSTNCKFFLSETIALSTIISTMYAYDMQFSIVANGKVKSTSNTNKNYFDISKQFIFQNDNDNNITLIDVSGRIRECCVADVLPVFAKQLRNFMN